MVLSQYRMATLKNKLNTFVHFPKTDDSIDCDALNSNLILAVCCQSIRNTFYFNRENFMFSSAITHITFRLRIIPFKWLFNAVEVKPFAFVTSGRK